MLMKTPAEGASTICYLAADPTVMDVSGYYFIHCIPVELGGNSENPEMAARLWEVSAELVKGYI